MRIADVHMHGQVIKTQIRSAVIAVDLFRKSPEKLAVITVDRLCQALAGFPANIIKVFAYCIT